MLSGASPPTTQTGIRSRRQVSPEDFRRQGALSARGRKRSQNHVVGPVPFRRNCRVECVNRAANQQPAAREAGADDSDGEAGLRQVNAGDRERGRERQPIVHDDP